MESMNAIKTGNLVPLSIEQIVDCADGFENFGCDGGIPSRAFEYIQYVSNFSFYILKNII